MAKHRFGKGNPGRPVGSKNKITVRAEQICLAQDFNPLEELIGIYKEAKWTYDNYATIYKSVCEAKEASGNPFPVEDKADKYLKIACDTVKEITGYIYPKLRSVELKSSEEGFKITIEDYLDRKKPDGN